MILAFIAGAAFWRFGYMPLQQADVASNLSPMSGELIVGTWTSADDAAYQVTFSPNGTLEERYAGDVTSTGTYAFAATPAGYVAGYAAGPEDDAEYLLEDIDGERYAYRVIAVTPGALELTYVERGNTLRFSR